jgi:glycosyltransferase involved in cell wall biosynthesis
MAQPLRVAVDANVLAASWGGIPKQVDRVVRELVARGDRVDLLSNGHAPRAEIPGARAVPRRVKGAALWRNVFLPLWALRERPDVFWAPYSMLPRWLPAPTVVTLHDLAPVLFPGSKPPSEQAEFGTAAARAARAATLVIAVSETTAADARRIWSLPADRMRVVPNGVDDFFTPGDRDAAAARVRERHDVDQPFVLCVGSLEPRKGLEVLIDAARLARDRGGNWRLVLVGAPGYEGEKIAAAARDSGACTVLGSVGDPELVDLYQAAEVLASASLYEGFGITPLEAMACGTPAVIAGNSGGLEEVSAEAAVVVPERSAEAWVAGIETGMAQRQALAQRGASLAARFRWPVVGGQVRAVLADAAASGRSRR